MSLTKSFAKNVFFKGLGELAIRLLAFAFIILVARGLGQEDFGVINFAYSFTLLFVVLVDFGLNPLMVRDLAQTPGQGAQVFYNLALVKAGLALLFLLSVGLGIEFLAPSPKMQAATYWLAVFVMLNSITEFLCAVFQAHQRFQLEAAVMSFQKAALLGFGLLALHAGWGLWGVASAYVAAGAGGVILAAALLFHSRLLKGERHIDFKWLHYAWQQALPLTLTTLFINLYFRIDMTLLGKMRPAAEVGWYAAAHKCIEVLMVIPAVLVMAAFPGFSQLFSRDPARLARAATKVMRLLLMLAVPLAAGAISVGQPLMELLFGSDYAPAGPAFAWLAVALGCIFLNYPLSYLLISAQRQKINALVSGLAVLVSVGANVTLIPYWGYQGAAVSALLTEIFLLIAYWLAVQRWLFPIALWSAGIRILLATAGMMVPVMLLQKVHVLLAIAAGLLAYALLAWILKLIEPEDIQLGWQLWKGHGHA